MPIISVIVPVYNTERYLRRCIDSILAQTFTDFELLLIDDGSTDASPAICDEYAQRDPRVRVFHKPNGGVSSARNLGLDNALGEWISFVDADDELGSFSIDSASFNSDLILGSFEFIYMNNEHKRERTYTEHIENSNLNAIYKQELQKHIFSSACAKLFKKQFLQNLRFDCKMRIGEDTVFILNYLHNVRTISIENGLVYIYNRIDSYSNKYQQTIEASIYTLDLIFSAYNKLSVRNVEFERNVFIGYRSYCQEDIKRNASAWFKSPIVNQVFHQIKDSLPQSYRLAHRLQQNEILGKLYRATRSIKTL